jgi:hypothetical protein
VAVSLVRFFSKSQAILTDIAKRETSKDLELYGRSSWLEGSWTKTTTFKAIPFKVIYSCSDSPDWIERISGADKKVAAN